MPLEFNVFRASGFGFGVFGEKSISDMGFRPSRCRKLLLAASEQELTAASRKPQNSRPTSTNLMIGVEGLGLTTRAKKGATLRNVYIVSAQDP